VKKLSVNLDAVVLIALVFTGSLGLNAWQYLHVRELMQRYVDAEWELGNAKANVVYTRTLLKACDPDKYADLDVQP
jgi:hypothetical protein